MPKGAMKLRLVALACLLSAGLQACSSTLGPSALSAGRPAYNEVIAATNGEQYLAWFVHQRYGLPSSQLAVSSITANVRFTTRAGIELGFGPSDNYIGNLVPFSGGVIYDENPTISYIPVQGEKHLRLLLSPIPVEMLGLLLNMNFQPGTMLALLVRRANGVPNPDFITTPEMQADHRFQRLVAVTQTLSKADKLTFFQTDAQTKSYHVWIHDYRPKYVEEVRAFLELLDIEGIALDGEDIALPVVGALRRSVNHSIALQTRSVLDLARIASASVEVPEEDRAAGLTVEFPESGIAGEYIRVQRASERPATAVSATRFRGWWYYVAGNDLRSKLYCVLVEALMSVQLSKAAEEGRGPVLTVPVN